MLVTKKLYGFAVVACAASVLITLSRCSGNKEDKLVNTGPTYSFLVESRTVDGVSADLLDIFFADADIGWAVGDSGTIIHTENGGDHWSAQEAHTANALHGVCFINVDTGWAVGDSGTIIYTEDGGEHWSTQETNMTNALRGVCFISPDTGRAVGEAVILTTANGGATWLPTPVDETLYGVSFPDASHGWVVGTRGTILRTNNGGQSWTPQWTGASLPFLDVASVGADEGWVVGVGGRILHTGDGGADWSEQGSQTDRVLRGIAFMNNRSGFFVGDQGSLSHTLDGGQNWLSDSVMIGDKSLRKIAFGDADHAWAAGDSGTIVKVTRVKESPPDSQMW